MGPSLSSDQHSVIAPVRAHASVSRTQPGNPAAHRRTDNAAAGLAADREADQSRRRRRARPRARSRRRLLQQPRIHRLPAEPDVVQRQRAQAELGHQHRAGLVQALHHYGIFGRDAIAKRLGSICGRDARRIEQILAAPRNAVQRPAILSRRDLCVRLLRLLQRQLARQRDHAMQLGIELLQPLQINIREPLGGELARLDPARELSHGRERNIFVARRQRSGIILATHEPIALRTRLLPRQHRIPRVAGATVVSIASFRGPVRRSYTAAIVLRQLPAATARSVAFISNCTNFSASAKVVVDTSGPTAGPAPNAGGAPGGTSAGLLPPESAHAAPPPPPAPPKMSPP